VGRGNADNDAGEQVASEDQTAEVEVEDEQPVYWTQLKTYIEEAENEGAVPDTFPEWVKDFAMWLEATVDEVYRVKVLTPDENDLMGNALYGLMEINEDVVEGDKDAVDYEEEVAYNEAFREIVEREWEIVDEDSEDAGSPE